MKDTPIIFSAPMVMALLEGRKTMTRRLAWREIDDPAGDMGHEGHPSPWQKVKAGDRLWVRENIGRRAAITLLGEPASNGVEEAFYAADGEDVLEEHGFNLCPWWKQNGTLPCIHMPRSVSRLTLAVTATKIEPLCDMSPEDAIAEGMKGITKDGRLTKYGLPDKDGLPGTDDHGWPWDEWRISPVDAFEHLWVKLHGVGAWGRNPEVVALTFTVHKSNIDALAQAA